MFFPGKTLYESALARGLLLRQLSTAALPLGALILFDLRSITSVAHSPQRHERVVVELCLRLIKLFKLRPVLFIVGGPVEDLVDSSERRYTLIFPVVLRWIEAIDVLVDWALSVGAWSSHPDAFRHHRHVEGLFRVVRFDIRLLLKLLLQGGGVTSPFAFSSLVFLGPFWIAALVELGWDDFDF